jgi:hypothetical protein
VWDGGDIFAFHRSHAQTSQINMWYKVTPTFTGRTAEASYACTAVAIRTRGTRTTIATYCGTTVLFLWKYKLLYMRTSVHI